MIISGHLHRTLESQDINKNQIKTQPEATSGGQSLLNFAQNAEGWC